MALVAGLLCLPAACSDYLDVNTNPNAPQSVAPNLYLAPMVHWLATSPQFDGRFIGHYTQEWYSLKDFTPDLHVILTLDTHGMTGEPYQRPPYPVTWARMQGKGHVFYTAIGDRPEDWTDPFF